MLRRSLVPILAVLAAFLVAALVATPEPETGGQAPSGAESQDEMAAAVNDFLSLLSSEQAASVQLPLDSEWRTKWHYFPSWVYERHGLGLGELSDAQRAGVHRVVRTALSDPGYLKASGIILLDDLERGFALELIAREGEQPGFGRREAERFGSEFYFFTVFGTPSADGAWGWRLEGHHLSLNFTSAGGLTVATPQFMGASPARVETGPYAGWRLLAAEEDLGRALIASLDEGQLNAARLSTEAPGDIITGPESEERLAAFEGVPASALNADQRQQLRRLIEQYVGSLRETLAADELHAMEEAGFERVHFAWAGNTEPGQLLYYRVHGPTLVIEFDNTLDDPNHIHSVLHGRDAAGVDLLQEHYAESPHEGH
ncbi:MAG: DUF3500 domain-containing protein [Gemmatimonadetes bacterium]|nr:DUF3500 domain-containing protein [Gemmatimonadota bacterium]